eukprot:m.205673 g.205673  ORF g.205673 m.205673 type:complete len:289 (+) comp13750_c0_seq4:30-896(+)
MPPPTEPFPHHFQLFLQSMLSVSYVDDDVFCSLVEKSCQAFGEDVCEVSEIVRRCNAQLERLAMKLGSCRDELTGEKLWALVNTREDPSAIHFGSAMSINALKLFKCLLENILSMEGKLTHHDAWNKGRELRLPHTNLKEIEELCNELVREGWIDSIRGDYTLGPRGSLELQTHLQTHFKDDLVKCMHCRNFVIYRLNCPSCGESAHHWCQSKYVNSLGRDECKKCHGEWAVPDCVESGCAKARMLMKDEQKRQNDIDKVYASTGKIPQQFDDDDDEDEDEDDDMDEE